MDEEMVERLRRALGDARDPAFGFDHATAAEVLPVVDKARGLPPGFAPTDLVSPLALGLPTRRDQSVRRLVVPDLQRLLTEAGARGHRLALVSAYRSYAYQEEVFAAFVDDELRAGAPTRAEAVRRANRYSALPGHSEHQLGTTVDVSVRELDFELVPDLGDLPAGCWLAGEAWRFGFVLSYPAPGAEERTGYVYEPWHLRWVGRPLAAWLQGTGFLSGGRWSPDQPVLREVLAALDPTPPAPKAAAELLDERASGP